MRIMLSSILPGSGKDTVADYLVKQHGFVKVSFAGKIYEIARDLFNMTNKNRALLQSIGQKMRQIDEEVWINYVEKSIREMSNQNIVISDLRQKNEYNWGIEFNFTPIRIIAPTIDIISRIESRDGYCDSSRFNHESEKGVEKIKMYSIQNNSTKEELYKNIDIMISDLGGL